MVAAQRSLSGWLDRLRGSRVAGDVGWVIGTFGLAQVLRFGTNIILAWLLSPAIFGVLALVTTIRTGVELLTDVGVAQNIVASRDGDRPEFIRTAWTIQAIRGAGLLLIGWATAWPLAQWYGRPDLFPILATTAVIFLVAGITPPAKSLMQRRRETRRLCLFDLALAAISSAVSIAFALAMPSVWGMIWANVTVAAIACAAGFVMMDASILRLRLDQPHARAILSFGKWIFASSLVYFAATNFDRLYLPMHIPVALFGVYAVARTIGEAVTQLIQRIGMIVVFPAIARAGDAVAAERQRIARLRRMGLLALTAAIAGGVAIADLFVIIAYDQRYAAAQAILPLLLVGTWFSVQAALGEAVLLGLGTPSRAAAGNAAKLAWTVILMPLAFVHTGFVAAFAVVALADLPRYLLVQAAQHRAGLGFWRQDAAMLVIGVAVFIAARGALLAVGAVDGVISSGQWAAIATLGRISG